jgi:hypothetical protein
VNDIMSSKKSNRTSKNEPWVIVNMDSPKYLDKYSRTREPQLKSSNMGSGQVARAAASSSTNDPAMMQVSQQLYRFTFDEDEQYMPTQTLSVDSNQTEETFRHPGLYDFPTAQHPLTANFLQAHDRQLAEMSYNLPGWTEGSGSQRLTRLAAPVHGSNNGSKRRRSRAYSTRYVEKHNRPSTISSGGMAEWGMVNGPEQAADDVAGSGSRFDDEAIGAPVYATQFLVIDEFDEY